ncbi:hypothetical protein J6590_058339 [Homalodisca vitripennis]|nr:hypothetical protein J6590_058339 [Homalodisca vitripennis]
MMVVNPGTGKDGVIAAHSPHFPDLTLVSTLCGVAKRIHLRHTPSPPPITAVHCTVNVCCREITLHPLRHAAAGKFLASTGSCRRPGRFPFATIIP